MTNDFARHFQDCSGALVDALYQPAGRLLLLGEVFLDLLSARPLAASALDVRGIGAVHQQARERLRVELNGPPAQAVLVYENVRNHHQRRRMFEA